MPTPSWLLSSGLWAAEPKPRRQASGRKAMNAPEVARRADVFLVEQGLAASRAEAQAAIAGGSVTANGRLLTKSSQMLSPGVEITYRKAHPFVSRGALKLTAALDHFRLSPEGRVCLDIG